MSVPMPFPEIQARDFYGSFNAITYFGDGTILTPSDRLTLAIRTDAHFATKHLSDFLQTGREMGSHRGAAVCFKQAIHAAYQNWGHEVVGLLTCCLDYGKKYDLHGENRRADVHFHNPAQLTGTMIQKVRVHLDSQYGVGSKALFISFDDMIDEEVFKKSAAATDAFEEIGFSRQFTVDGRELQFVGRPGKSELTHQIENVVTRLKELKKNNKLVPIVLLEDNVRRAKTLLWIFDEMEKQGVFRHGELAAIATCFCVADDVERQKIVHNGRMIPLVVSVDYGTSKVDVITPRDHLFDGMVVHDGETLGRLPSFFMSPDLVAQNFKINPVMVSTFMAGVLACNKRFCQALHKQTGVQLTLSAFASGTTIATLQKHDPDRLMCDLLGDISRNFGRQKVRVPPLRLVREN